MYVIIPLIIFHIHSYTYTYTYTYTHTVGAQQEGMSGFFKGLGAGVLGAVVSK
jgi:hypothetical protein